MSSSTKARLAALEQRLKQSTVKRKTLDDFYNELHLLDDLTAALEDGAPVAEILERFAQ